MLFDFNKIPYHQKPLNFLARLLVACDVIGPRSRDLRYLRAFERKIGKRFGGLASLCVASLLGKLEPVLGLL